ncbi:amino acid ABC transporter permease [Tumebacillus permanentifrigoris]|uniref:Amino acid ABC transporter membrane protein 2 (PAAT family) n=1 Tax=Tumebacillus permanentifrigoris TaxID=378543 RepID=A0A316D8W6_9BACL|nr:amino acid ABC transporter permease [Tumebacillus permanentifrigoris]PWK13432.1 amino acid ABC transporter membrane protein 2 (PAAT family) [Tumebacillus permanentifrigoris]
MDFAGAFTAANLKYMMQGLGVTLEIAIWSIALSFLFGTLIAILRYARIPVLSQVLMAFVEMIRNLPLLLIIFFTFFAIPEVMNLNLTPIQAAIAALSIFEAAMISEIVRAGLNSIPKGQVEAARSSGLGYVQTLRHIVLPQALRKMVPPLVSQFISLIKDTTLTTVIAIEELLRSAQIVYSQKQDYVFPMLILAALTFFVINYALSLVAGRLERRFQV